MRNMSFALTTQAFIEGRKDVTRRVEHHSKITGKPVGWALLKPGEYFTAVEKSQGLRKGEHIRVLCQCICTSNEPERLSEIITAPIRTGRPLTNRELRTETEREGFPNLSPQEFLAMFCKNMKCSPSTIVRRIQFRKV